MLLASRELYCPSHFGNSFECLSRGEKREWQHEAHFWGLTRYADWFDTIDCSDPYAETRHYQLAHALWDRRRAGLQTAGEVGLSTGLVLTPNHVCVDHVTAETVAEQGDRAVFGQLVCPSKPGVRNLIQTFYRNLFADLATCGVSLASISPCPYDYGGCTCEHCAPWILTFASLCADLLAIAREYHPEVELHPVGWWWKAEEHRLFADYADQHYPGEVKSLALHIPYGQLGPADVALPQGCAVRAFVHNGYADQAEPKDIYGKWGPVIAPTRLPSTLQGLAERGAVGYMAYCEGVYEDVNRSLLGALSAGLASDVDGVLRAYARRYFAADDGAASEWSEWLQAWGRPFDTDLPALREAFDRLSPHATPGWRLEQWACKLKLFELRAAIGDGEGWPPARRLAAEGFVATMEHLHRRVYGLGPTRHIFGEPFLLNEPPTVGPSYPPLLPELARVPRPLPAAAPARRDDTVDDQA